MNASSKDSIAVVLAIALIIATIIGCWYIIANNLVDTVFAIIGAALLIIAVVAVVLYIVVGTAYFFGKKDTAHNEYTSTLDDLQEVDREMNKDKP